MNRRQFLGGAITAAATAAAARKANAISDAVKTAEIAPELRHGRLQEAPVPLDGTQSITASQCIRCD